MAVVALPVAAQLIHPFITVNSTIFSIHTDTNTKTQPGCESETEPTTGVLNLLRSANLRMRELGAVGFHLSTPGLGHQVADALRHAATNDVRRQHELQSENE